VGLRAGLDTEVRGKSLTLPGTEPRSSVQTDTILTELPQLFSLVIIMPNLIEGTIRCKLLCL
jgi:hypothetical protein